jgi:Fe-Mn family superoxide dismutase
MNPVEMTPAMELALRANFGSLAQWREAFVAMDRAQGERGDKGGWMRLVFQPRDGRLVNQWAAGDQAAGDGEGVILALRRPVDAGLDGIPWGQAYERYQHAVEAASQACGATQGEAGGALLLDVRRAGVFEKAAALIPGARWCDPGEVSTWAAALPKDRDVVVYCVYGHEVGRATALRLRAAGVRARYLEGGIDGWLAAGLPVQPKEVTP